MLGRGTRRGDRYPDKSHFTVFDCFGGTLLQYFRSATAITADPPEKPTRTIAEIIEEIWANRDRDYNVRCLVKRLQRIDKEMAPEARERFEAFGIPGGNVGPYAAALPASLTADFTGAMKLLRDPRFQELLVAYQRRPRLFLKADEYEDTVTSTSLLGETRPEDYLAAFSRFVSQHEDDVDAIAILLSRPRSWGPEPPYAVRHRVRS